MYLEILKFEILLELPNVTEREEVSKCCWKNGADRFAQRTVVITLQFVKKQKTKQNPTISAK